MPKNKARPSRPTPHRTPRRKSGSIMIMVVALLVLMALIGTAYIATARLDRGSASQNADNVQIDLLLQSVLNLCKTSVSSDLFDASQNYRPIPRLPTSVIDISSPAQITSPLNLPIPNGVLPDTWFYYNTTSTHYDRYVDPITNKPLINQRTHYWLADRTPDFGPTAQNATDHYYWGRISLPLTTEIGPNGMIRGVFEDPTYVQKNASDPLVFSYQNDTELQPISKDVNGVPMPAFQIITNTPSLNPYTALAADADADGIADSFLTRMPIGVINGVTYYYAVRIVDNAAAVNLNTAWADNGQRMFPTSINLIDLLAGPNPGIELNKLRNFRLQAGPPYNTPGYAVDLNSPRGDLKPNLVRGDFGFRNEHDALWHQLGRRPENPGYIPNASTPARFRAFALSDMVALSAHFVLNYRYDLIPAEDVFATSQTLGGPWMDPSGAIRTKPYAPYDINQNPYSWGSQNFNYNGNVYSRRPLLVTSNSVANAISPHYSKTEDTNKNGVLDLGEDLNGNNRIDPLVATNDMLPYYPPPIADWVRQTYQRGDFVYVYDSNNVPIPYVCNYVAPSISPLDPTGDIYWEFQPHFTTPLKTSINTATFRELYRAYWNVMSGEGGNDTPFGQLNPPTGQTPNYAVPHDPYSVPNTQHQFRSSLRDTHKAATGFGSFTYRFPPFQQLLLRAALASVNTIDMRDNDDDVTSRRIILRICDDTTQEGRPNATRDVEVEVYGFEKQPFITEVYAHTDNATKLTSGPGATGEQNPKGYVAVELYNPFDTDIKLDGYRLGVIDRRRPVPGAPGSSDRWQHTIQPITKTLNGLVIKAKGHLVLENFEQTATETEHARNRPPGVTVTTSGTSSRAYFNDLYKVFEDSSGSAKQTGGELVLLRPRRAAPATGTLKSSRSYDPFDESNIYDLIPVDSFDFTGLKLQGAPAAGSTNKIRVEAWHYIRENGNGDRNWKCVYPGRYNAGKTPDTRRHEVDWIEFDAPRDDGVNEPSLPASHPLGLGKEDNTSSFTTVKTNEFPPIQLNNRDSAGPMPVTGTGDPNNPYFGVSGSPRSNSFPFGGFQRVGDIMQVPFIGGYRVREVRVNPSTGNYLPDSTTRGATLKNSADVFLELNSISMDCAFADDSIDDNNQFENIGRFCPLSENFTPYAPTQPWKPWDPTHPDWKLHTYDFAHRVFDYFTVFAPHDDYFPNFNPDRSLDSRKANTPAYRYWNGTTWKSVMANVGPNGLFAEHAEPVKNLDDGSGPSSDERAGVHGLININTANWKVLSTVPFTDTPAINEQIARAIVTYRDYGDQTTTPARDPRPFESMLDLMNVRVKVGGQVKTFRDLHYPPGSNPPPLDPNDEDGDFSPFDFDTSKPKVLDQVTNVNEFEQRYLLPTRISNLLTTRSDSFTAYVIVQGWRNANTPQAELVVQRRAAMLIDRAGVTKDNREPRTMLIPVE
jgi:hypothetical protein